MTHHGFRRLFLVVLLLLAVGPPAFAARRFVAPSGSLVDQRLASEPLGATVVLADSWDLGKFVSSGGRTRIVQICAVVMGIALFIMMRKLY